MKKTIVVLANSKKPGGRCLAGKELVRKNNAWEVGPWIRPVTTEKSGAVSAYQMSIALGHIPKLLEIVEIPLTKEVPMPEQPENWLLETPILLKSWQSLGFFEWKDIKRLLDNPATIWNDQSGPRRVKAGYPQKMDKPASLYLIKPESIQSIRIWRESNQFGEKKRRRVIIRYAKESHEFDIDDIDFAEKHYPKFPRLGDAAVTPKLQNPAETIICVSLALEHVDHYHYKIAAAFFEPPP